MITYDITPSVEFVMKNPRGGRERWFFSPSTTFETILTFLSKNVYFCSIGELSLGLIGRKSFELVDSVNSLGLGPGPINVMLLRRSCPPTQLSFYYRDLRVDPPRVIEQIKYDFFYLPDHEVSDSCQLLSQLLNTDPSLVEVFNKSGEVLPNSTKLSRWAFQKLQFSGKPQPEEKQCNLNDWLCNPIDLKPSKFLADGATAIVKLMSHPTVDMLVAAKILKRTSSDEAIFNREFSNLISLHHPCTQSVIGWCKFGAQFAIITEFLENGSLEDVLKKADSGNPPTFLNDTGLAIITVGILLGLRHLHNNHFIHRDLKPGNVLIDHRGYPQIADFGVSRVADFSMTLVGIGTDGYKAPESSGDDAEGKYTETVDIYSFGIMLFQLVTGKKCFQNMDEIKKAIFHQKRPDIPMSVIPEIRKLICDCWSHNPERPNCTEILERLRQAEYRIRPDVDPEKVEEFIRQVRIIEGGGV
jgi:hypothetical protein